MVQSLNTKAILTLASVVRRPGLMTPHVAVDTISQINFDVLKARCGIEAVIFDKDNTLTAPYINEVHPNAKIGLQKAIEIFGLGRVAILSNSAGTNDDKDYEDAIEIEQSMGIKVIRHSEKKPGGLSEVLSHFDLQDPATLCMVGDRLLTDVVFGNLHGMLTVHTLPLCQGRENSRDNTVAKVIRGAENKALYGNWFGGRWLHKARMEHKFWPGEVECPLVLVDHSESNQSCYTDALETAPDDDGDTGAGAGAATEEESSANNQ